MMGVTIREVAQRLNLSITTISRALDGYDDVAEETRQLVVETARQMGYTPNQAARHLRRNKADAVGFILPASTPRFSESFFSEFIAGLGDETAHHPEFDLLISIAPPGEEAEKRLYQSWVAGRKVDGFILNRLHEHDWRVFYLWQSGVPFSALEHNHDGIDYPSVEIDRINGLIELVEHITENGFHRIAFIGGRPELKLHADQLSGYRLGLERKGLTYCDDLVVSSDLTSSGGYQAAKHLVSLHDPPDGMVCINDETAFGALHAAHEAGLQVGKDIAIAGFDGVQAARYSEPPLTTLDIPVYDTARQLVQMLLKEINDEPLAERRVVVKPRLLVRESTGGKV